MAKWNAYIQCSKHWDDLWLIRQRVSKQQRRNQRWSVQPKLVKVKVKSWQIKPPSRQRISCVIQSCTKSSYVLYVCVESPGCWVMGRATWQLRQVDRLQKWWVRIYKGNATCSMIVYWTNLYSNLTTIHCTTQVRDLKTFLFIAAYE